MLSGLLLSMFVQAPPSEDVKLGAYVAEIRELAEPVDVAIAAGATLFVLEWALDRVRVTAQDGAKLRSFGRTGSGPGELRGPRAIALGPEGLLWIADTGNHRIQAFTQAGEPVASFGVLGIGPGELIAPTGLDVRGQRIYVADTGNHRIQIFDREGTPLLQLGTYGSGPGQLNHPADVAVDADGNLYVADTDNHRVQKLAGDEAAWTRSSGALKEWGDFGPHPGFFASPTGIELHGERLFVADRDNHRVQVFDTEGGPAYTFGLHAIRPREGEGKLHYPRRISISPPGDLAVVAEAFEDRLQLFGPTAEGTAPPSATAMDRSTATHWSPRIGTAAGLMTLVEPTRPGIQLWDVATDVAGDEPINITRISNWGRGFGQLLRPTDAAIDAERGLLYVVDPAALKLEAWRIDRDPGPIKYDPHMLRLAFSVDLRTIERNAEDSPIEPAAIELAPDGTVWMIDARRGALFELFWPAESTPFARFLTQVGREPVDLAFAPDGGRLYVADRLDGAVLVLRTGLLEQGQERIVARWSEGLVRPAGVAVDGAGNVYVSDAHLHTISKLSPSGELLDRWGSKGLLKLELFKPGGIALRNTGQLIVMDDGNHRAQIVTTDGEFVHAFGSRLFTRPIRAQLAAERGAQRDPGDGSMVVGGPVGEPQAAEQPEVTEVIGAEVPSNAGRYLVRYRTEPDPIPWGEPFALQVWVLDGNGDPVGDAELTVDGAMPEHGHGMNRVPVARRRGPPEDGAFDVTGMLLHMPGRWEVYFDLTRGALTERAQIEVELE